MLIQPQCPKDSIASVSTEGWDQWVSCPADQLLTGLNVGYREKRITALGVRCKRVGWFTAPSEPAQDVAGELLNIACLLLKFLRTATARRLVQPPAHATRIC